MKILNFKLKINASKRGFTLIELLVVITIIGILAGGLLIIINPLEQINKAKDAQRRQDLAQIKIALDTYYNDHNKFPNALNEELTMGTNPYIKSIPKDPSTGSNYFYVVDTDNPHWNALFAKLSQAPGSQNSCPVTSLSGCPQYSSVSGSWGCTLSGTVDCGYLVNKFSLPDSGIAPTNPPFVPTATSVPATPTPTPVPPIWARKVPVSPPPVRIYNRNIAYDSQNNKVVLFGGIAPDGSRHNDTWVYDTLANTWTEMHPASSPPARLDSSMAYDSQNNKVVLFGGYNYGDVSVHFNDTWVYDTLANTWTEMHPASSPPARNRHNMVYDSQNNRIVLFGGYVVSNLVNDIWVYNTGANTWEQKFPLSSVPNVRDNPDMVYDSRNNKVVLFGGGYGAGFFNDTWVYDTLANTWTEMHPASSPPARDMHKMAYDSQNNKVVLFGGHYFSVSGNNASYNDTWVYDTLANTWTEMHPASSPPARLNSSMAYDSQNNKVVLFGGQFSGVFTDMWMYGAPPPTLLPPSTAYKRVFVTSTIYNGDLKTAGSSVGLGIANDGLDGADKICQSRANAVSLGGTWKAWLSDSTNSPSTRFSDADRSTANPVTFKLLDIVDGAIIANSWTDLTDGTLINKINKDEFGNSIMLSTILTNTNTDGSILHTLSSNSCNNWSSLAPNLYATLGYTGSNDSGWTIKVSFACFSNAYYPLYCFEQ